jgi:hypothetical protein
MCTFSFSAHSPYVTKKVRQCHEYVCVSAFVCQYLDYISHLTKLISILRSLGRPVFMPSVRYHWHYKTTVVRTSEEMQIKAPWNTDSRTHLSFFASFDHVFPFLFPPIILLSACLRFLSSLSSVISFSLHQFLFSLSPFLHTFLPSFLSQDVDLKEYRILLNILYTGLFISPWNI